MGQDLSIFDGANVPAHLRTMFRPDAADDLSSGVTGGFPIISYKGKVWNIVESGNRTMVTYEDGEPRSSIEVVIVKANPKISKNYYAGGYEEGSTEKPTCYSHDGEVPSREAASPQAAKCAICPRNQWGSKVTENGAKGKECVDSRRLAVAAAGDLSKPMLLRVPAGSLRELAQYADLLKKRQAPYQALVTKIAFDHEVAYPRFTFKPVRWLTNDEAAQVAETLESPTIPIITGEDDRGDTGEFHIEGERPTHAIAQPAPTPNAEPPRPVSAVKAAARVSPAKVDKALADAFGDAEPPAKAVVSEAPTPKAEAAPSAESHAAKISQDLDALLAQFDD